MWTGRCLRRGLTFALIVCVTVGVSAQFWYTTYAEAEKAIEKKQFARAELLLRDMKKAGGFPRPGRNRRANATQTVDFFPDYLLGIALLEQGKKEEAKQYFDNAQRDGYFGQRDPEFRQLQAYLEKTKPVIVGPPAGGDAGAGNAAAIRAAEEKRRREELNALLAKARDQNRAGRYVEARGEADRAAALNVDPAAVDAVRQEIRQAEATSFAERADRALRAGNLGQAEVAVVGLSELDPKDRRLPEFKNVFERLKTFRNAEREGIQAFLSGRYEVAVRALTPAATAEFPHSRVEFFLACSHAAIALLASQNGTDTITTARRLFVSAVAGSNDLGRERSLVSPSILAVLENTNPRGGARRR